jgi:hypothetical protein
MKKAVSKAAPKPDFLPVFTRLKSILQRHAADLIIHKDTGKSFYLITKHVMPHNKQPLWFGGVQIMKNYVSYHLIPMYGQRAQVSPRLQKRMQGKTCFNFTSIDESLFKELDQLTRRGARQFKSMPDFSNLRCD